MVIKKEKLDKETVNKIKKSVEKTYTTDKVSKSTITKARALIKEYKKVGDKRKIDGKTYYYHQKSYYDAKGNKVNPFRTETSYGKLTKVSDDVYYSSTKKGLVKVSETPLVASRLYKDKEIGYINSEIRKIRKGTVKNARFNAAIGTLVVKTGRSRKEIAPIIENYLEQYKKYLRDPTAPKPEFPFESP